MEFPRKKTNTFTYKTLFLSLVFFLVIISFFPLININSVWGASSSSTDYLATENPTSNAGSGGGGALGYIVSALLLPLDGLARLLLSLSQTVFTWILDTKNIETILGNDALYASWTLIRDLLNMAFIMILLWSAFCTIFQVEQYNYKKLLWKIVLMALLVNFSFPIARFIIDASNILMYSLIGTESSMFTGESFGSISKSLTNILTWISPSATYKIASIVMIFMLAVTLLAVGILLLIRLIALAILLILSPIAFVGSILPGFSSYASKWWDNLFKYSFFGPIMIFGVIVTIKLMNEIGSKLTEAAQKAAGSNTEDPTFLGAVAFVMVPIVLLWMVMGIAQSMSIAGAGTVMGGAQKIMKGAGKKFSGYSFVKRQYDSYAAERKKREAEKAKHSIGGTIGKWANRTQDTAIGTIPIVGSAAKKRADKMRTDALRKDVDDKAKELKDNGISVGTMTNNVNNSFDTTGAVKSTIIETQAAHAKAYTNKSADQQKLDLQREIRTSGLTGDLQNILAGASTDVTNAATAIKTAVIGGIKPDENDLRTVIAHMNDSAERVMRAYIK